MEEKFVGFMLCRMLVIYVVGFPFLVLCLHRITHAVDHFLFWGEVEGSSVASWLCILFYHPFSSYNALSCGNI